MNRQIYANLEALERLFKRVHGVWTGFISIESMSVDLTTQQAGSRTAHNAIADFASDAKKKNARLREALFDLTHSLQDSVDYYRSVEEILRRRHAEELERIGWIPPAPGALAPREWPVDDQRLIEEGWLPPIPPIPKVPTMEGVKDGIQDEFNAYRKQRPKGAPPILFDFGQCTWYVAWRLYRDLGLDLTPYKGSEGHLNAGRWAENLVRPPGELISADSIHEAIARGCVVVAERPGTDPATATHVAVVEGVYGSPLRFEWTEMNHDLNGGFRYKNDYNPADFRFIKFGTC